MGSVFSSVLLVEGLTRCPCQQHQLFFGVRSWPDKNGTAGPLITLPGHGLYYACLIDN